MMVSLIDLLVLKVFVMFFFFNLVLLQRLFLLSILWLGLIIRELIIFSPIAMILLTVIVLIHTPFLVIDLLLLISGILLEVASFVSLVAVVIFGIYKKVRRKETDQRNRVHRLLFCIFFLTQR